MYEDSWYSYIPESSKKNELQTSKTNRRKSLLNQTNGTSDMLDLSNPIVDLYESSQRLKSPPKATLAKRAKSYSDFYEVAVNYLEKTEKETPVDIIEQAENDRDYINLKYGFEEFEDELLDRSQEEFRLYHDQLALSERHLDTLLSDTASALDLLATLSESFRKVESETTAFQAQCEDLLAEQKRLRDLADEVGTDLQYYAYLEPLTRRLNAPGAGRVVRSDDFLDMLMNLNACIDFMDQHPSYRDSSLYKTRYISLLERSLNLVQIAFSSAFREISDEVSKELRVKDHSETTEYILLYGKSDVIKQSFGPEVEQLIESIDYAFGQKGDSTDRAPYVHQYHDLYSQLVDVYVKSRELVGALVTKRLVKFATTEKPDSDFQSFARRCIQYVLDVCHNEQNLVIEFFNNGPLLLNYNDLNGWTKNSRYAERFQDHIWSYLTTLSTFLLPFLSKADLQQVCGLVNWLETMYLVPADGDMEDSQEEKSSIVQALLSKHLWVAVDTLFLQAAKRLETFRPTQEDLRMILDTKAHTASGKRSGSLDEKAQAQQLFNPSVSSAYPTVKTAVSLLVMYNESTYERPQKGDVLYEIVHQVTESLQKAATSIKKLTGMMEAQLFLIKNLMLIENLFMTHEIPDSIRESAEFDFTPIWDTIQELQDSKQLFNPLAYIRPLVKGKLLPAVVDKILDARKELEKVLVQQITAFTKTWQSRLLDKDFKKREVTGRELNNILNKVFDDETTRAALWKMIRAEE